MKPVIEEYVKNNPDVEYKMIDIDNDFDSLTTYDVLGVPTYILLNDNKEVNRHTGAMPKQDFLDFMAGEWCLNTNTVVVTAEQTES